MRLAQRCFLIALLAALVSSAGLAADQNVTTVRPQDTGEALANPGMGWVLHHYDNIAFNYGGKLEPSDTVDDFPGVTTVYLRIAWSHLEPKEGRFCWSVLDTPAQRWHDKGKRISLRISCCESFMRYATPAWVEKAGAKGHNFKPGTGVDPNGPYWEPDYDDPIFLEKLDHFLAALAERYDGNPEVDFIDVGSFGVWGEGHTFWSTKIPYSAETIRTHIDLHTKHFKKTLLAANDDFASHGRGRQTIEYAAAGGLTLRDDSILVQGGDNAYFNANFASLFWEHVPFVLESRRLGHLHGDVAPLPYRGEDVGASALADASHVRQGARGWRQHLVRRSSLRIALGHGNSLSPSPGRNKRRTGDASGLPATSCGRNHSSTRSRSLSCSPRRLRSLPRSGRRRRSKACRRA